MINKKLIRPRIMSDAFSRNMLDKYGQHEQNKNWMIVPLRSSTESPPNPDMLKYDGAEIVESYENGSFLIRARTMHPSRWKTFGWYVVDPATGEILPATGYP